MLCIINEAHTQHSLLDAISNFLFYLGKFGSMEKTRTGCDSDLLEILGISKNDLNSRSVNIFQWLDVDLNPRTKQKIHPDER